MQKITLDKLYPGYFTAGPEPRVFDFPQLRYISIEGSGNPNEQPFADKAQALYITAFSIKQAAKQEGWDFTVSKLEGLWWTKTGQWGPAAPYEDWQWKLLIALPGQVQPALFEKAAASAFAKKQIPLLQQVKLETWAEGKAVQLLHTGPYSAEAPSLEKLHGFMRENGLEKRGVHHEIYLSTPGRTPAEKLKTILRQPIQ